jgi:hypothetical protein
VAGILYTLAGDVSCQVSVSGLLKMAEYYRDSEVYLPSFLVATL